MLRRSPTRPRRLVFAAGALAMAAPLLAQPAASQAPGQAAAGAPAMLNAPVDPALQGFRWRPIGPTGQGGRIHAVDAIDSDPTTFYIGFATGGLWKTTSNGVRFDLVFPVNDDHHTHSIGAIAIAPSNPSIVYVGTGEACNRQSSSFGAGVYKTTDGGATFTHLGLRDTQSISRIAVHPTNPDIVWVAANGSLWASTEERGLFMSTDGGRTWNKTLYIDPHTGVTDVVVDRRNPTTLFAATYQRQRSAWGFIGGGPGSGIHQSVDGGRTWRRLSGNGLPDGVMGRVGLAISRSNPNVVYAQIESASGNGVWRSGDRGRTWTFQSNENNRPMYYSHIMVDPSNEHVVYIGGLNAMRSDDGGRTWTNIQGRGIGHVDNHAIWISPNGRTVMYGNDGGLAISWDGAQTFEAIRTLDVGQPYHVSADMRRPYWVCTGLQDNGSWCGPSSKRSGVIRMSDWFGIGGGDGFQTQVDPTDHRVFYSESQNGALRRYDLNVDGNAVTIRPVAGGRGGNIRPEPPPDTALNFNWNSPIRISPHNPRKLLFGGNRLFISLDRGDTWRMTEPLGKNYDATQRSLMGIPYSLPGCGAGGRGGGGREGGPAPAAPGGQPCIPSKGDGVGVTEARTIIEIAESPIVPGLYWAGTADGNIQVSRDDGYTWTEVSRNLPGGTREYWVSGLEASWFDPGTAYVSLDGHHSNDLRPYVFKTTDYGQTWTSISGNLPWGHVNSIRQDPVNPRLLYVAAEFGFFISLDEGARWHKFMPNLPTVRVDEVLVHPRDNDLIVATHGRSIWVMNDITPLQQLTPEVLKAPATLLRPRDAVAWKSDPRDGSPAPGAKHWAGESAPAGTAIAWYLAQATTDRAMVRIVNTATGQTVRTCIGTTRQGLNQFQWTLSADPQPGGGGGGRAGGRGAAAGAEPPAAAPASAEPASCAAGGGGGRGGGGGGGGVGPGVYRVTLTIGGKEIGTHTFRVLEDVWMHQR